MMLHPVWFILTEVLEMVGIDHSYPISDFPKHQMIFNMKTGNA